MSHSQSAAIPTWGTAQVISNRAVTIPPANSIATSLKIVQQRLQSLPSAKLESALEQVRAALQSIGTRLYINRDTENPAQSYQTGAQPQSLKGASPRPVEEHLCWQQFLQTCDRAHPTATDVWTISYLQLDFQLRTLADAFKQIAVNQLLVIPLYYEQHIIGCLSVFRQDEVWSPEEIHLLQQFGLEFAEAIGQHRLTQQVFEINQQLAQQTQTLQQSLQYQQSVTSILVKIRASIELEKIFHSAVNELFHGLQVDRVSIYRFNPDWSGGVIAEAVGKDWQPFAQIMEERAIVRNYVQTSDTCVVGSFPNQPIVDFDEHLQVTQGGDFAQNCTIKRVPDIYQQNFSPCYVEFLAGFDCRAYLTAPIYLGDRLWGLLATYQNTGPRDWAPLEVCLVGQTAEQLGIAIQQAELLEQTRSQQQELSATLTNLQSTQSQLVHAEKMSSLGQLVAGIAHEVNNPVNFVHGNLNHLSTYFQDIFGVLDLCQQYQAILPPNIQGYLESIDLDFICEDVPKVISSMEMGTKRISEIVLSLRNFSRLDEAEVKSVDLHDGIDSTCLILQNQCQPCGNFPGIQIIKQYADLPPVECYAGQINQVFMNILGNAIDALKTRDQQRPIADLKPNSNKITIITEMAELRDRPSVLIRIRDNGPGIPETTLNQIFNPFFTTKPIGKGTGLGLSISYRLITEKHQGELRCISTIGTGTEFQIEIPVIVLK